jgi:DNA-binding response OmpR family regulator
MDLEAMIVSCDWQEVAVLECILNDLHVGVRIEQHIRGAQQRLTKSKVDALILDRDLGGTECLLKNLSANNASIPLILISRTSGEQDRSMSGATFFFEKPISVEQAVRTLSATRNLMMASRMRYHRHMIDVPVALRYGTGKRITAQLKNLSSGGLSVRVSQALRRRAPINIRFRLPGLDSVVIAKGELAWADGRGYAGIRFLEIPPHLEHVIQQWLEQRYLLS